MSSPATRQRQLVTELHQALAASTTSPAQARQMAELVALAEALEGAAAEVRPSQVFRAAARRRLLAHMATSPRTAGDRLREGAANAKQRVAIWLARFAASAAALALTGAATASASASALPGDILYPVKQASEAVAVQAAPSEAARQEVLLHQADARLDETSRLLQQGRDGDALTAANRFAGTVDAVTAADGSAETAKPALEQAEARLSTILKTAPAAARPGIERALESTQRGLAHRGGLAPSGAAAPAPVQPIPDTVAPQVGAEPKPTAEGQAVNVSPHSDDSGAQANERRSVDEGRNEAAGEARNEAPGEARTAPRGPSSPTKQGGGAQPGPRPRHARP